MSERQVRRQALVGLRQILATNRELAARVEAIEQRYDTQFKVIFEVIQKLMAPPEDSPREEFGFTISKS